MARNEGVSYLTAGASRRAVAVPGQLASRTIGQAPGISGAPQVLATIVVPGGTVIVDGGSLRFRCVAFQIVPSVNSRSLIITFGGVTVGTLTSTTSVDVFNIEGIITRLSGVVQCYYTLETRATGAGGSPTQTVRSAALSQTLGQDINFTVQVTVPTAVTDLSVAYFGVELLPDGAPE